MISKILASVFIFFFALFLSSCSGLKDIENYKGENLSISVGDTASVSMTADTHNGYDWIVAANSDPSIAKYTGKENLDGEKVTDKTTQVIKFKGLKKGKTIITLNYVKKGDMLAKQTRTLNITVY
jgi:PBP1b-binding outer membrane lipoprotein LpoB